MIGPTTRGRNVNGQAGGGGVVENVGHPHQNQQILSKVFTFDLASD
ncbi:hypothetical protein HMPREF1978_00771 [Actinomyces graevenitzii F0530]|uniref:Uncharacterized protein n=1 Tax=Actinomyces graevenitzii F0530 TaxID=1321817 RepID=U1RFB1_9ACTO|nr:hypothetical protein HMPREF1978_00771 [Actinomyces graevenitzii F0530]